VHYVEVDEPETGLKYKAPPKLPKPEPKGITQQVNVYACNRQDSFSACTVFHVGVGEQLGP